MECIAESKNVYGWQLRWRDWCNWMVDNCDEEIDNCDEEIDEIEIFFSGFFSVSPLVLIILQRK